MQKKDNKVGNKTGHKKKRARKNIEIDSQKKKEIWLMRMPEKQKSRLITSSKQKFKSWVLEISFPAIPMLTGRKTVQKKDLVQNAAFSLKVADAKGYKGPYDTKMATPMKTSHPVTWKYRS